MECRTRSSGPSGSGLVSEGKVCQKCGHNYWFHKTLQPITVIHPISHKKNTPISMLTEGCKWELRCMVSVRCRIEYRTLDLLDVFVNVYM